MGKRFFGIVLSALLVLGGFAVAGAEEATQQGLGLTPLSDEELSAQKGEGLDAESTDAKSIKPRRRRTTEADLKASVGQGPGIVIRSGNALQNNLTVLDAGNSFSTIRNTAGGGG